jgi:hypothetical protein
LNHTRTILKNRREYGASMRRIWGKNGGDEMRDRGKSDEEKLGKRV